MTMPGPPSEHDAGTAIKRPQGPRGDESAELREDALIFAENPAHARDLSDIFDVTGTSLDGLGTADAQARLADFGPNSTPAAPRPGLMARILEHVSDVLVIILLVAAVLKAIVGDWVDFAIILVVAVVNVAVGLIQEGKAEKALDSIKSMLALTAEVKRGGRWETVDAETLVVGDVVRVRSGARIPADMRLIEAVNLQADESVLTGESDAVVKTVGTVAADAGTGDRSNMLHSGTLVTAGTGSAIVTATGPNTEIGRIQTLMAQVEPLETPLSRQLDRLGKTLAIIVGVMAVVMVVLGLFVHDYSASETLSATIGFAVAAIPEGLPALVTITLAMGVQQMARRHAITRRLTSVEALGSVTTICSDKTGTLTKNEMTARVVVLANERFKVEGEGYDPTGALRMNGARVEFDYSRDLAHLIAAGSMCNDAQIVSERGRWELVGAPTEGAIRVLADKANFHIPHIRHAVLPFESSHKFMATIDEFSFLSNEGSFEARETGGGRTLHAVGAPDRLLRRCAFQFSPSGETVTIDRKYWEGIVDELGAQGLRVLAICGRDLSGTPLEGATELGLDDAVGLVMYGLVGIVDPPRPEAITAIAECQRAGIDVVMITGDHSGTATAIASELGIIQDQALQNADGEPQVMVGADLDHMSATELQQAVRTVRVFARTSPEHKLRIVEALQKNDHVVAMTGDGVNDAPALQKADVGVAMGIKGTEATKEAADIVLTDDNFATIEGAVEEGRRIFDNIRKSVIFLLPTNGAQSLVILIAVLFGWALPLTPAQILWVNMITAITLSLALAYEPAEPGLMDRKPRDPREGVLSKGALVHVLLVSLLIGVATLFVVWLERHLGSTVAEAQTAAVTTLTLAQLAYLFNCRFLHRSSITADVFKGNKVVWIAALSLVVLQVAFTLLPFINSWFGSAPIGVAKWAASIGLAVAVFFVIEIGKKVQRSRTHP